MKDHGNFDEFAHMYKFCRYQKYNNESINPFFIVYDINYLATFNDEIAEVH